MDLSKMLEDLYPDDEDGPAAESPSNSSEPLGPEWADEARLEEVFSSWTPGPPSDAPQAERHMADQVAEGEVSEGHGNLGDDLDLRAELDGPGFKAPVLEASREDDVVTHSWTRSEDDVLVGERRRSRLSLRRR